MNKKTKRRMRRIILALFVIFVLAAIGIAIYETKRGARLLAKARADFEAAGGSFDPQFGLSSPVVHHEQNFGSIPALAGITKDNKAGEKLRARLELIGLRDETHPWPEYQRKNRKRVHRRLHEPPLRLDLEPFRRYFNRTQLLSLPEESEDLAVDILAAFDATHGDLIKQLNAARPKPQVVLIPTYSEIFDSETLLASQNFLGRHSLNRIALGLRFHAILSLRTGDNETALADIETIFKLSEAVDSDGKSFISHLTSNSIIHSGLNSIWEGLVTRQWDEVQLATLQEMLVGKNHRTSFQEAVITELASIVESSTAVKEGRHPGFDSSSAKVFVRVLRPWLDANLAIVIDHYTNGYLIPLKQSGYLEATNTSTTLATELENSPKWNPRSFLAAIRIDPSFCLARSAAITDVKLTQAATACALERYYLEHNQYPTTLSSLTPKFLTKNPLDPIHLQPLRYKKNDSARYQLHSVGTDGIDNEGNEGDITWNYSNPPASE